MATLTASQPINMESAASASVFDFGTSIGWPATEWISQTSTQWAYWHSSGNNFGRDILQYTLYSSPYTGSLSGSPIFTIRASAGEHIYIESPRFFPGAEALNRLYLSQMLAGNDSIYGSYGNDTLFASTGNDSLAGYGGNDQLKGEDGNDVLDGGAGIDTLIGGAGNDIYIFSTGDIITEASGGGTDTVQSSVTYTLGSNLESLTLIGTAAINGTGNTLNNILTGNSGNNTLNGGAGIDTLVGGAGNDAFRFMSALSATANVDTIRDFSVVSDTLQIDNLIFTKLTATGALNASFFKANATGTATDSNDYIVYETDTGKLFYDADGSGAGVKVQFALIGTTTHAALTAADFVVI